MTRTESRFNEFAPDQIGPIQNLHRTQKEADMVEEAPFDESGQRVKVFVPAARDLLTEETERCLETHICFTGLSGSENG